ncbi:MAG: hypothetical protein L6416_03390 [Candidatus Omnitrophica bacterium]|nr:hypothetical protein [Candidatus Omnitrophota bacterium]
MKKLTGLFLLFFLLQAHAAQAAEWMVKIVSNKDSYELQEEAVFGIEIRKNGKLVSDNSFIIQASFPDAGTAVSLLNIKKGKYRFNVLLDSLLEEQILAVKALRKGKKETLLAEGSKTIIVMTRYENSFTIKEGNYTSNNEITLEIDSVRFYEMAISEDPMFTNCVWMPYASVLPFYLSNGDSEKTIYVKFRHKITQEEQIESARIILDTIAPEISSLSPVEGSVVTGKTN